MRAKPTLATLLVSALLLAAVAGLGDVPSAGARLLPAGRPPPTESPSICICLRPDPSKYDSIFVGTFFRQTREGPEVKITRTYKGPRSATKIISIAGLRGHCPTMPIFVGETYLFFASEDSNSDLTFYRVGGCGIRDVELAKEFGLDKHPSPWIALLGAGGVVVVAVLIVAVNRGWLKSAR